MCDHQEKIPKRGKTASSKSQQVKPHHQTQGHYHQSDDSYSQDTQSTAESSIFSDHHSDHGRDKDRTRHSRPHHHNHKTNHHRVSLSGTSLTSSSSSSSSSTSSSPSSSSSCSSSSSSSTSSSSSSLSSDTSGECWDRHPAKKPLHSQSCTDISRKHRYFEERDDTTPLIDRGGLNRLSAKQKQEKGKSSHVSPAQSTVGKTQKITRGSGKDGSFRKSKSMEALTRSKDGEVHGNEDVNEVERRKTEARKNLMKEKMKFSAFLNEITRQVLSPMRLTTLGVTDAQRSCSPQPVRSSKPDSSTEKHRQQRSRPTSADSARSSKHSTQLSNSKSLQHHGSHHSAHSPSHLYRRPKSCTDITCLKRPQSRSPPPHRHTRSSSHKRNHQCRDHHSTHHHRRHEDRNSLMHQHHHTGHHKTRHHHHHRHHHRHNHADDHRLTYRSGDQHNTFQHHRGRHSPSHHHHHGDPHHVDHFSHKQQHGKMHHLHHGNHHGPAQHHHHDHLPDHQLSSEHADHHIPKDLHHHRDRHKSPHHHHHGDHSGLAHHHFEDHGDREPQQHHHRNHQSLDHHQQHGEHQREAHHNHHEDHHSESRQHYHGDNHRSGQHCHYGDQHSESHQHPHVDQHSSGSHHRHGDHHSPSYYHHHRDHHTESHQHHHEGDHSDCHQHHCGDHHNVFQEHYHGDHHSPGHQHHLCHTYNTSHHQGCHPETHYDLVHDGHDDHTDVKGPTTENPPSHRKSESLISQADLSRNSRTTSSHDEEETIFTDSSLHKEKTHELGKIMMLQEKNEGLHQSLLQTAVRMECLGEEFMSSQKLLEAELQNTRMDLSNLTERFRRLHDSCSSTQQTNDLLQQKLHSVAQSMEGERERLHQRISILTEQLADAKFANSAETFNATSFLQKTNIHFQSDDAIAQMVPPVPTPPVQFMDGHNYGKDKAGGQEQSLGSVPEEEESDWSEMGEDTPRFTLMASNRAQARRHQEGHMDMDSESKGEETVTAHTWQIPQLQFTIHSEISPTPQTSACPYGFKNLSDDTTGEGCYRITSSPNCSSSILIRSASLEEIPLGRHGMQKELRVTEAMMDLHLPADDVIEDLDNEIIHHWRTSSDMEVAIGRRVESRASEADCSLLSLQSAEQMLSHFIRESQCSEGKGQGRAEVHGWTGALPDKVLKGERTKL